jgi:hypothetical protein
MADREFPDIVAVGNHSGSLDLQFSANPTVCLLATVFTRPLIVLAKAESLRASLHELEALLGKYPPVMGGQTEKVLGTVIAYGVVFAGVSPPKRKPERC